METKEKSEINAEIANEDVTTETTEAVIEPPSETPSETVSVTETETEAETVTETVSENVNETVDVSETETTEAIGAKHAKQKNSIFKKIRSFIGSLLTLALVASAVYFIIGWYNQEKTGEMFFPFGYRAVKILTGSMEEEIQTGAIVIIKETKDVVEDDIIFFITDEGTPVVHRYVDTNPDGSIVSKGDANPKEDTEPVTDKELQGKVIYIMNWFSRFA